MESANNLDIPSLRSEDLFGNAELVTLENSALSDEFNPVADVFDINSL